MSVPRTRREVADRAIILVGGTTGWTKHFDPEGFFALVTEGRQQTWVDANGKKHAYSACQDLVTRLGLEVCGMKQKMPWCNRVDGGNRWISGQNLIRLKNHASYAWKNFGPHAKWDIHIGDGVEVMGRYGPHTRVITEIEYNEKGDPILCDHADYGQFHDPDGDGPEQADHSCRLYLKSSIRRDSVGRWTINGAWIIGRADLMLIQEREVGHGDTEPAPPNPDHRILRKTFPLMRGEDVAVVQAAVGAKVDGDLPRGGYGNNTEKKVSEWKRARGIPDEGNNEGVWNELCWSFLEGKA